MITDTLEIELLMLGVFILMLTAILLYLVVVLGRIERTLYRLAKYIHPEVLRDAFGNRLHIR